MICRTSGTIYFRNKEMSGLVGIMGIFLNIERSDQWSMGQTRLPHTGKGLA